MPEVVLDLLIHPALGRGPEGAGQPHGHLGADAGTAIQDGRQGLSAHTERLRSGGDGEAERFQAEGPKDFTRVGGLCIFIRASVIVLVVDGRDVDAGHGEGHAPVAADCRWPCGGQAHGRGFSPWTSPAQ